MICNHCGNNQTRVATVGRKGSAEGRCYYLICNNCERVIFEDMPDCIPDSQKRRFIKRIQKGKNDST
jgi:hypothetical protein